MTFLEKIFGQLQESADRCVLRELRGADSQHVTGSEFITMVRRARGFLANRGLKPGDRCVLLASNSVRWAALDLALMAEGVVVVPLYPRQAPAELAGMIGDADPARIFCDGPDWAAELQKFWPTHTGRITLMDGVFGEEAHAAQPYRHVDSDAVTIIYTSGTSGEPKGVVLNAANLNHMLECTNSRLDQLMGSSQKPDRVFHYLPFCFAGSWILLLTALSRASILTLCTDLASVAHDLKVAEPHYFLNVPTFLERVRRGVEEAIQQRGAFVSAIFSRAYGAYARRRRGQQGLLDSLCLAAANSLIFPAIRKGIGSDIKAVICGSAPLAIETQLFFTMLGIPVLQVYGLTETTAICTMDDPAHVEPGRVGPAIPGIEMKVAENGEVLVCGPNVFPGYWERPQETAKVLEAGWFHTGDQGDVDSHGNWRITGRLKNLIILNSGHNVAPEPLEESLERLVLGAEHVMLLGDQRSYLTALVVVPSTNGAGRSQVQSAIESLNATQPHYKQIRAFHFLPEPFTIENGLLTANGKLKRDAIATRFASEIAQLYEKKPS
jgi:long-chain acyl-CoA synthetase